MAFSIKDIGKLQIKDVVKGATAPVTGGASLAVGTKDIGKKLEDVYTLGGASAGRKKKRAGEQAATAIEQAGQRAQDYLSPTMQGFNTFISAGQEATSSLQSALGLGGAKFDPTVLTSSPAFQFAMEQGLQAGRTSLAGTGLVGRQAKELTRFASGLASQTFQQHIQNLFNVSQQGRIATGEQAGVASHIADLIYGAQTSAAEARLGGKLGAIATRQAGISNFVNLGTKIAGYALGGPAGGAVGGMVGDATNAVQDTAGGAGSGVMF